MTVRETTGAAALRRQLLHLLQHDRLWLRALTATAMGVVLFYAAWGLGYAFLPEGALRGWLPSGNLDLETGSVRGTALRIFLFNLAVPGGLTYVASWVQVGRYSLGYNIPFLNIALYGLWLGTNSFAVPMPEQLAPTLAVLYQRSGPTEMLALTLLAAVFAHSGRVRQVRLLGGPSAPVPPAERQALGLPEYLALLAAVGLLALANWREAGMLLERIQEP